MAWNDIIRYIKFDTFTPAVEKGLPVTRVISRMTLQQILARAVGDDAILNESNVIKFEDNGKKVQMDTKVSLLKEKSQHIICMICFSINQSLTPYTKIHLFAAYISLSWLQM